MDAGMGLMLNDHTGWQDEAFATGIDTGAYTGEYLTGVLFPPLANVEVLRAQWENASAAVTLSMLGAEIVQVKAKRKYNVHSSEDEMEAC